MAAVLLLFLLWPIPVALSSSAQPDNDAASASPNLHQWGAVTLFHGLPSNHVRAIAQDTDGTLWFGTDSGLTRYDGRRIEKIAIEELAATRINALKMDRHNTLWIATDNGAFQFSHQQFKLLHETLGKAITAIAIDAQNRIAMVSEPGIIFICTAANDSSLQVKTLTPADYALLNLDANNRPLPLTSVAWAGDALIVGSHGRGLLKVENSEVNEINSTPRAFFIEAITTDVDARLWFGAQLKANDGGLYQSVDANHPIKSGEKTGTVSVLSCAAQSLLWAGTQGQGVFVFKDGNLAEHFTFENTAGGLRSNNLFAIFIDREGVVWFGTDRGVCRYDPQSVRVETIAANPESNFARVLAQTSDGLIWCGSNRGLFVRSASGKFWSEVEEFKGKTIYALSEDAHQRLLIGTAAGLFAGEQAAGVNSADYFAGRIRFTRLESEAQKDGAGDSIRSICEFQGAVYLAVFGRGIERLDGTKRTPVFPSDNDDNKKSQVLSVAAKGNEALWFGTARAGVFLFDGRQVNTDAQLAPLNSKTIWSIAVSKAGAIWLASDAGLFVYANRRLLHVLKDVDARQVIALPKPENAVWCATADNGLYKVLLNENLEPILTRFDTEQGLPSQKIFAVLTAQSEARREVLIIGTNKGIARFAPGNLAPALKAARVIGNRLFQTPEIQAGLALEYPQNSLLVEVTAISSRTFPEQFQYRFVVQNEAGKIVAQKLSRDSQMLMEGLQTGGYTLTAQAFTNELIASDPLTIRFTVKRAPFPLASTALAILLAFALLAMWWGYRQNRMIARSNAALASTNQQLAETRMQLANETETERRRIARDLHDQTLADLRRLMMLSDELATNDAAPHKTVLEAKVFRSEIESVSAEIRRICEDLSPSVLENVGFAAALEYALTDAVAHLPAANKFEYEFVCEEGIEDRLQLSPVMQIHLYRIAQEVINNISRHSAATRVRLTARIANGGALVLEIEDNGRGFQLATAEKRGRGLANIRSRASLIEAEVNWSQRPEGGTLFTLQKAAKTGNEL
ncbi:MAG: hypothetical protein HY231_14155 [Acidobacteria bacterium]|nr:hypothetical protein [Acidobacteriota bacterium]